MQSHLDTFCYKRHIENSGDHFRAFLSSISSIYRKEGISLPEGSDEGEAEDDDDIYELDE